MGTAVPRAGLVHAGDFDAFLELVRRHENASSDLFDSAFEFYLRIARTAKVETGLEGYSPRPPASSG